MDTNDASSPVLFFDGVCNLCNSSVQFVIRHDKKKQFLFATLQSAAGLKALKNTANAADGAGSFILFYQGRYYSRSTAALQVLRLLGGAWSILYAAIIVPRFIRDAAYNLISRNRYKWFGKKNECMLPTPELKKRFL